MIGLNRRRVMGNKKGLLPSGYTQLDYIENRYRAYIDTGVRPTATTDIDFTFSCLWKPTSDSFICGCQQYGYKPYNAYIFVNCNAAMQTFRYNVHSKSILNTNIPVDTNVHTVKVRTATGIYIFDDNQFVLYDSFVYNDAIGNIVLFGLNENPKVQPVKANYPAYIKVYGFSIMNNDGMLYRHFIPCISPNNVVGMYDTVEGVFYSSPNGAAFIAGPKI